MAISPTCSQRDKCTLYVAAAGGGVWRRQGAENGQTGSSLPGNSVPTPSARSSSIPTTRQGTRCTPGPASRTRRAIRRPASASTRRRTAATRGRSCPAATSSSSARSEKWRSTRTGQPPGADRQRCAWHQLGDERRAVEGKRDHASASTPRPLAPDGCHVYADRPAVALAPRRRHRRKSTRTPGVIYVNDSRRASGARQQRRHVLADQHAAQPTGGTDRAEFARATLPNGNTRMYVGDRELADGANRARFYRTDNAYGAAMFGEMAAPQNIGYCTAQCWYDNVVYTPAGDPDVVYLGGSFSLRELHGASNGRAGLCRLTAAQLERPDAGYMATSEIHPDQHAIVTVPGKPLHASPARTAVSSARTASTRTRQRVRQSRTERRRKRRTARPCCRGSRISWCYQQGFLRPCSSRACPSRQHPQNSLMGGTQDNGTNETKATSNSRRRSSTAMAAGPASARPNERVAFQHVHGPGERRQLPQRRPDQVGDHLGVPILDQS